MWLFCQCTHLRALCADTGNSKTAHVRQTFTACVIWNDVGRAVLQSCFGGRNVDRMAFGELLRLYLRLFLAWGGSNNSRNWWCLSFRLGNNSLGRRLLLRPRKNCVAVIIQLSGDIRRNPVHRQKGDFLCLIRDGFPHVERWRGCLKKLSRSQRRAQKGWARCERLWGIALIT